MSAARLTPHQAMVVDRLRGGEVLRRLLGCEATLGFFRPAEPTRRRSPTASRPFVLQSTAERLVALGLAVRVDRSTGAPSPFGSEWRAAPDPPGLAPDPARPRPPTALEAA